MFSITTHSQHHPLCHSLPQGGLQVCAVPRGPAPLFHLMALTTPQGERLQKCLGAVPGSAYFFAFLALHWPHFGNRSWGAMVAEIKVSTWRKSPSGQNTDTRLSWGHVGIHSISQDSVDHRLPFVARRVDVMVPTRQLLPPAPPVSARYLGPSRLRAWGSARPSSQHPSLRRLSVTGFSEDPGEAGSHTHATPRSCQDCVEPGFPHLTSRPPSTAVWPHHVLDGEV